MSKLVDYWRCHEIEIHRHISSSFKISLPDCIGGLLTRVQWSIPRIHLTCLIPWIRWLAPWISWMYSRMISSFRTSSFWCSFSHLSCHTRRCSIWCFSHERFSWLPASSYQSDEVLYRQWHMKIRSWMTIEKVMEHRCVIVFFLTLAFSLFSSSFLLPRNSRFAVGISSLRDSFRGSFSDWAHHGWVDFVWMNRIGKSLVSTILDDSSLEEPRILQRHRDSSSIVNLQEVLE